VVLAFHRRQGRDPGRGGFRDARQDICMHAAALDRATEFERNSADVITFRVRDLQNQAWLMEPEKIIDGIVQAS